MTVSDQAGVPSQGADGQAVGVLVEGSSLVELVAVVVTGVTGSSGKLGSTTNGNCGSGTCEGGEGIGVALVDSVAVTVVGCTIADITGGIGGRRRLDNSAQCGRTAGVGVGISVLGTTSSELTGNAIVDVTGPGNSNGSGGTGGVGAALRFQAGSSGNVVEGNTFATIAGGTGGPKGGFDGGDPGGGQQGYGVYFEAGGGANTVAATNTHEGDPILYSHGETGRVISGWSVEAAANPTNLGAIVVVDGTDIVVANNRVADVIGEAGDSGLCKSLQGKVGNIGEAIQGIYVDNCAGCSVVHNDIWGIEGGAWRHGSGRRARRRRWPGRRYPRRRR